MRNSPGVEREDRGEERARGVRAERKKDEKTPSQPHAVKQRGEAQKQQTFNQAMSEWVVHKFGGSSVATADGFRQAAQIVLNFRDPKSGAAASERRQAVVVSAMGSAGGSTKVTDLLLDATTLAAARDPSYEAKVREVRERHEAAAAELLRSEGEAAAFQKALEGGLRDLGHVLRAVWLSRRAPDTRDLWWSGLGEVWSAALLAAHLREADPSRPAAWLDARGVMTVEWGRHGPHVDVDASLAMWRALESGREDLRAARTVVVTGYVGRLPCGAPTTLGRDGSDYTASAAAAMLGARCLTIWKDVDGVFSANPGRVPAAVVRDELTYQEAMELSYFGSKVLHPKTMAPLVARGVPVWIRNSFRPDEPGTCISAARTPAACPFGVRGVSVMGGLALVTVEGAGLIGVLGTAHRFFGALSAASVNVVLITQASSEHSITVAVHEGDLGAADAAVRREFRDELEAGAVQKVELMRGMACLAVIGDGMASTVGVSGRLFGSLARARCNVMAVAQGSSERNISVILRGSEADAALRAVHAAFVELDPHQPRAAMESVAALASQTPAELRGRLASLLQARHQLDAEQREIERLLGEDGL